jgi:hypothetical protein
MIRPRFVACALFAAMSFAAPASFAAPPGFAFLEIPCGARVSGLGGAGATFARGAEAAFWNPAALGETKGVEVTGSHYEMYQALRHEDFALAGHAWGGGIAASISALYSGNIDEYDELGNLIGGFGAHDLELGLGYGHGIGGGVQIGGSTRVIRGRIANASATTYAFSFGGTWDPAALEGLRLSLEAQNLGPAAAYTIDGVKGSPVGLPAATQGGVAYAFGLGSGMSLATGLEGRFTNGRNGVGILAAELTGLGGASIRSGFRMNDTAANFTAGVGWNLPSMRFDYAWVPSLLDLEDTHRVAFTARF